MTAAFTFPPTPLTHRQHKILDAIRESRARRGIPATRAELAVITGVPAEVVLAELGALRAAGWLRPASNTPSGGPGGPQEALAEAARPLLAPRHREVLQHAADGLTNSQIGSHLGITRNTVKTYLSLASKILDAHGRAHAVAVAIRSGLIT